MASYRHTTFSISLTCVLALLTACGGSSAVHEVAESSKTGGGSLDVPGSYDAKLAEKLGADEYGMKQYVLAFLKSGPTRDQTEAEADRLQRAHLDNITRMAEEGQLVLAGPFLDDGELRGIYVFDVRTVEEARALTETDPAIQAGRLEMDLRPWYGSAALAMINDWHGAIAREGI